MKFIEAKKILSKFSGGVPLQIRLATSSNVEPMLLFIQAVAAERNYTVTVETLEFGTLAQSMLTVTNDKGHNEVVLLMPWDLVPEYDWRSGIPMQPDSAVNLLGRARVFVDLLRQRQSILLYVHAPVPPIYLDPKESVTLQEGLMHLMFSAGAHFVDANVFSLGNYLGSGVPIAGSQMGNVAKLVMELVLRPEVGSAKVLVTDLDNVMWAGVVSEDGADGIECGQDSRGFRHFIYQNFLSKLKASGVLLAAVSRNDLSVALSPINSGRTSLRNEDFVEILASYEPKSLHLRRLAEQLNLGLDSFVFVDDNPIELAEISAALPMVRGLQFPLNDDALVEFLQRLSLLFARDDISDEDRSRTEMYRRRMKLVAESKLHSEGGDLASFLVGLGMKLTIYDRGIADSARAIQLINKTNQFNLNGRRFEEAEIEKILSDGGHLYTATLDDRTGSHGEILACLIDSEHHVKAFVLSCRVFQRRVEYAFLAWLLKRTDCDLVFIHSVTERNTPIREFLNGKSFVHHEDLVYVDKSFYLQSSIGDFELFEIKERLRD